MRWPVDSDRRPVGSIESALVFFVGGCQFELHVTPWERSTWKESSKWSSDQ